MVFDGERHLLEEKTLLFFLCFAVSPMAAFPILSMIHAQALPVPPFHYVPSQSLPIFFSNTSENLPLAFHPKSYNSSQTSYCLISVISFGF